MYFDARSAKGLKAGDHIVVDGCQGLRLVASNTSKSWIYRYKSPLDDRMRQVKIGEWPAIPFPSAVAEWEGLRKQRDAGVDPSLERKAKRSDKKAQAVVAKHGAYTVARLVDDYISGYVVHHRIPANAKALASRLRRGIEPIANLEPSSVTRSVAFELIQSLADRPVMASSVKQELGAAWEHAYDSGKLREDVPNWWRQILKGCLQSKGQLRDGVHKGTDKRVLTEEEIGRLSVTHWSPHDLRRTSRTMLAKMGCPEEVGEAILGHVTPGVAGVYNRYRYDAEKLQWLQRLSERLESIVQAAHS